MHGVVTLFASGEPSKTPLYIAGGVLALWAVAISAFGIRKPDFPGSVGGQRGVIAVSAVLVAGVIVAAVAVAAIPEKSKADRAPARKLQGSVPPPSAGPGAPPAPAPAPAGGGGASPPPAASATVQIAADPSGQLAYTTKTATAKAGKVTIDFTNQSPVPHDVTVELNGKKLGGTPQINASKASVSLTLKPGTYTFYCSVDSHRQAGMQGTLTVQ